MILWSHPGHTYLQHPPTTVHPEQLRDLTLHHPTPPPQPQCIQNNCEIEMEDSLESSRAGMEGGITNGLAVGITEDAETLNGRFAM